LEKIDEQTGLVALILGLGSPMRPLRAGRRSRSENAQSVLRRPERLRAGACSIHPDDSVHFVVSTSAISRLGLHLSGLSEVSSTSDISNLLAQGVHLMQSWSDIIGYLAAILLVLTFFMRDMVQLRITAICSSIAWLVYGFLNALYPIIILHLVLAPLNAYRLWQSLRQPGSGRGVS
jgi:hypothetical protein